MLHLDMSSKNSRVGRRHLIVVEQDKRLCVLNTRTTDPVPDDLKFTIDYDSFLSKHMINLGAAPPGYKNSSSTISINLDPPAQGIDTTHNPILDGVVHAQHSVTPIMNSVISQLLQRVGELELRFPMCMSVCLFVQMAHESILGS